MEQAVVVSAARTPVGRYGGVFRDIKASTLLSYAVKAAVERANIDPGVVDEVVVGHVLANGENPNVARLGWLEAGFPIEVPAYTLDRQCGSGLQAIVNAGLLIQTGDAQVVVAGGVESESTAEYYVTNARWGYRLGDGQFYDRIARAGFKVSCPEAFPPVEGMMHTSEKLADRYQITREEADQLAVRSHQNAIAAIEAGKFRQEIVPVPVKQPKVGMVAIDTDEGPRKETSPEALAKLPVLAGRIHTAGNASSINDGAAAVVVMTESKARELGLEPRLYFRGYAAAGVDPTIMGIGPVPAVRKVMAKTGLCLDQMDLVELNEAFAAQALSVLKELDVQNVEERVNVNGSGISLGHPLGATGARILVSLLHEMERRNARLALETMCTGGGQGLAAVWERR